MIVNGEGHRERKLWLVGECPGVTEERTGRPFVGGSGQVLDGILRSAGIDRSKCYIDNVVQRRPPGNNFGVFYKDKGRRHPTEELLGAQRKLIDGVRLHKPNVIVALGNEALYALTGKKGILKWRGSILSCGDTKVIPTVHPAMVMRMYEYHPIAVMDFNRIKRESASPAFPTPYNDSFLINPSYNIALAAIQSLRTKKRVSFDIETANGQIMCIGFAWSKEDAVCIPIFFGEKSWWTLAEETAIVNAIRDLFLCGDVEFIAQNAQFDMIYLADRWNVEVSNLWMDTMVGFHCLHPELKKGLGFINSIYTNRPYYKDMPQDGGASNEWLYNQLDCVVTWEVAHEIEKELKEFKTWDFYRNNSHALIHPLINMQRRGIGIDAERRSIVDKELEKAITEMERCLSSAVGYTLNTASPKQMKDFLYNDLQLPPQRNRKTKALAADEDALATLSKKFPCAVFDLILDIRKARKLLSTYVRATLDEDGRIRCSYVLTGTKTGRLASRKSIYGTGGNHQNIPRGDIIRSMFIADPGTKFINSDLSQAEARVVAYISNEERLQNLFLQGGDVHTTNAALIFNKTVSSVTKDERQTAKTLVHAANYCIGPRTFAKHINSTEPRARELLNHYYTLYPGIKNWHREVKELLQNTRILRTPMGRARMFFGRWSDDLVREAIAYVPQSTVADILNLGIIRSHPNMPPDWKLLMQVHDSVLAQVPIDTDPMHILKFFKHYFEIWIEHNRHRFLIPIDIKQGPNWASLTKLET